MAEERIKVKRPRPRDYWREEAIQTATKIRKFAYGETEDLEIDLQELRYFADYTLLALYKEENRVNEINRADADKLYFEEDYLREGGEDF